MKEGRENVVPEQLVKPDQFLVDCWQSSQIAGQLVNFIDIYVLVIPAT